MSSENALDSFYAGGPSSTAEAFPPICLRSHWDPTAVTNYILPPSSLKVNLALDPRQSVRICTSYYNTSAGDAPVTSNQTMQPQPIPSALRGFGGEVIPHVIQQPPYFPVGGAAGLGFPYKGFQPAIESDLLRVSEQLTLCAERRYLPPNGIPAESIGSNKVPGSDDSLLSSNVLQVKNRAGCREADDKIATERSNRLFFNPTRYDRTTNVPANLYIAPSRQLCKNM